MRPLHAPLSTLRHRRGRRSAGRLMPVGGALGLAVALVAAVFALLAVTPARAASFPGVAPVAGSSTLRGVTCRSATDCVVVGYGPSGGVVVPVTNGTPGAAVVVPGVGLHGVACPDAVTCVAVGETTPTAGVVVVITNGIPGPVQTVGGTIFLQGVACPTPAQCVAVGGMGGGGGGAVVPIVGGVAGPAQLAAGTSQGGGLGRLRGIACATSTTCVAAGRDDTQAVVVTVTNGIPGTAVAVSGVVPFQAVSCRTASTCEAAGDSGITEVTDGTPGATRGGVGGTYPRGVSCPAETTCTLVDAFGRVIPALSTFGFVPNHVEPIAGVTGLWGITCTSVDRCLAVGNDSATGVVVSFSPPAVTTQPGDQTVVAGQPVSFRVAGDGVPAPYPQWQVSTDGGATFTDIPGATSPTYGFTTSPSDHGKRYRAVFKNVVGATPTAAAVLTVQVPTTTTLSPSPSPSVFGQEVTFTATVNPTPPGGTVRFSVDGSSVGAPVSISSGQATFTMSSLGVGSHPIGATYSGADNFLASERSSVQTVNPAATATALGSSAAPSVFGQEVTFTATVAPVPPGAGSPTGTVQFSVDGTQVGGPVTVSSGQATFRTSSLGVGNRTVAGAYSGDGNFVASQGSVGQTVNKAASGTSLSSSAAPSVFGQEVTFTATVTPSPSAGRVQFSVDGTQVGGPVTVSSGQATFTTSSLGVGNRTVAGAYSGDGNFVGSQGSLGQTVNRAATAATLASSAGPSVFGQEVTFTATVAPMAPGAGSPTGTVQFSVDGTQVGSPVALDSGTATFKTSSLGVGNHTVAASYSGDGDFIGSQDSLGQTVNRAATAATLASSAGPSVFGQEVTFTATVTPVAPGAGSPTGTVQFSVDGTDVGDPAPLNSGKATLNTADLAVGDHTIAAVYSGDGNFVASQGDLDQTVNKAATAATLASSAAPSVFGQEVTFTATVAPMAPGAGKPTGTVQFSVDGTDVGDPATLSSGKAVFTTSELGVGKRTVTAAYSGDGNFVASQGDLDQTVNKAATVTTLSSSPPPSPQRRTSAARGPSAIAPGPAAIAPGPSSSGGSDPPPGPVATAPPTAPPGPAPPGGLLAPTQSSPPDEPQALRAVSPTGSVSGPPGVGLAVSGSGHGGCDTVYFSFDDKRIGAARPDGRGQVRAADLSVPGDTAPGPHTVTSSCRASGRPTVASVPFEVTPAGLHRGAFASSLHRPSHVAWGLGDVALSVLAALALLALVVFPAHLFENTLAENYDEVRGWFGFTRPVVQATRSLRRDVTVALFLVGSAVVYSALDPSFGLTATTLATVLAKVASIVVVTLVFSLPALAYMRARHRQWGRFEVLPGTALVAVACVVVSRLVDFQPGYFYGFLAGFAFQRKLTVGSQGRLTAVKALCVLGLALAAWIALAPVATAVDRPGAGFWLLWTEGILGAFFVGGIESVTLALLPMRFMDGPKLMAWSRATWAVLFAGSIFLFVHLLLRPGTGYVGRTATGLTATVALFISFGVLSCAFWAYFRFRPQPAMATTRR